MVSSIRTSGVKVPVIFNSTRQEVVREVKNDLLACIEEMNEQFKDFENKIEYLQPYRQKIRNGFTR